MWNSKPSIGEQAMSNLTHYFSEVPFFMIFKAIAVTFAKQLTERLETLAAL